MANRPLYDLESVDLEVTEFTTEQIQNFNPQRFEFAQLERITAYRPDDKIIVACRDLTEDEFWTRGHMPGRPIFPGVMMLETAAQLCSFYTRMHIGEDILYGFGGADKVRFRRMVTVGDRLVFLAKPETITPRRSLFQTQAILDGKVAFEAEILGIALPN